MKIFFDEFEETYYWIKNDPDTPMSPVFDDAGSAHQWYETIKEDLYSTSVQIPRSREQAGTMMALAQMWFKDHGNA